MKRLLSKFAQTKACIIAFVTTRLFYFERTQSSVDWCFWYYKIKRREPVQDEEKRGKYKDVAVIDYRRSFMKGYAYITISFFHYFTLNIDLHRPL
jgi:hypothetical protein